MGGDALGLSHLPLARGTDPPAPADPSLGGDERFKKPNLPPILPPMSKTTPATLALSKAGIAFDLHPYAYDPDAPRVGLQAAEALGWAPEQVFKTLMTLVDLKPVCVIIPSDAEVSMKKLAAAHQSKSAQMMKPADAERLTGYKVGGVSPFGQRKPVPTYLDESAILFDHILINAGQRGLLLEIAPRDAASACGAIMMDLKA